MTEQSIKEQADYTNLTRQSVDDWIRDTFGECSHRVPADCVTCKKLVLAERLFETPEKHSDCIRQTLAEADRIEDVPSKERLAVGRRERNLIVENAERLALLSDRMKSEHSDCQ